MRFIFIYFFLSSADKGFDNGFNNRFENGFDNGFDNGGFNDGFDNDGFFIGGGGKGNNCRLFLHSFRILHTVELQWLEH